MRLVAPDLDAGGLGERVQRAALVSTIAQIIRHGIAIAGDKTGAQARQVGTLGEAMKYQAMAVVLNTQAIGDLQQTGRRGVVIEVNFRITFVGGNDKVVLLSQPDEVFQ